MNLLCPNCQKLIQVSEQYAGQEVRCPLCNGTFTVPVLPQYHAAPAATPSPPAPPAPGVTSEFTKETQALPTSAEPYGKPPEPPRPSPWSAEPATLAEGPKMPRREPPTPPPTPFPDGVALPQLTPGYQHLRSIWISPRVVQWVPLAALALVFLSMFSAWVVFIGRADDTLTGWQLGFGSRSNLGGTLYVLLFVLSLLLAVAAAVLPRIPPQRLHPSVPQMLPWSGAAVGGTVVFAFLFLIVSLWAGHDPEGGPEMGTGWMRFAAVCLIAAIAGAALDLWLTRRGRQRPLPRIDITW